jgi:2-oxoglutarate/2-oxoacid ferredoxin oxidoreductase subunit alpha
MDLSIKITGTAGNGIFTLGLLISKLFKKINYTVFYNNEFPSVIKGGHNKCFVRISKLDINCSKEINDILICMNEKMIEKDIYSLKDNGILIINKNSEFENSKFKIFKINSDMKYKNMSFFSSVSSILGFEKEDIQKIIKETFEKKGDLIINNNLEIIDENFDKSLKGNFNFEKLPEKKTILIDGNLAIGIGSIKAGVGFVGEYPITPSTTILHYLIKQKDKYNICVRQTEDEIASVMSIIGAGSVGVRAMSATSGAGFSLMCEGIGMAATSETGIVIFNVQRAGSSTGLPTYTGQADLNLALNISHGENSYIILAPGDIEECFYLSFEAFNLADIYQTPVIVLTDKFLAESKKTIKEFDESNLKINRGKLILNKKDLPEKYKRYEFTKDNISPKVVPGIENAHYINSSYEHDETGFTTEDEKITTKMLNKRFSKLNNLNEDFCSPNLYGKKNADLTIICWGSTKGVCIDVINELNNENLNVNMLHFNVLNPLKTDSLKKILNGLNKVLVIEGNKQGQLRNLISKCCGIYYENLFLKYNGREFKFEEVKNKILSNLKI